jgi:hypothetical protein
MSPPNRPARLGLAIALAPLAAPLAIWGGLLIRALILPTRGNDPTLNPVAVLVLAVALIAYGAPLAYAATLAFVWPVFRLLESVRRADWWWMAAVGAVAGVVLFPAYLKFLDPHAFFRLFPGAGALAGGANAIAFWYIAERSAPRDQPRVGGTAD